MKKEIKNYLIKGVAFGIGFIFTILVAALIFFHFFQNVLASDLLNRIEKKLYSVEEIKQHPSEKIDFIPTESKKESNITNVDVIFVDSTTSLFNALNKKNLKGHGKEIVLSPGTYRIEKMLNINNDNTTIRSLSRNPSNTIIEGPGMEGTEISIFRVLSNNFKIQDLTIQNARLHLIQIVGEASASYFSIEGCILRDAYQQFIKISYDKNKPNSYSSFGNVKSNIFYFTDKIGPNYYTGGIDGHGVRHWTIENNVFKDIASPSTHVSEHAIHLWNNVAFNIIKSNLIIDSDRGIGIGLGELSHRNILYGGYGDLIENNIIINTKKNRLFSDVGIALEKTTNTTVSGNLVYLDNNYNNAIEYRFKSSGIKIYGNYVNKDIKSRNSGVAIVDDNKNINKIYALKKISIYLETYGLEDRFPTFTDEIIKEIHRD